MERRYAQNSYVDGNTVRKVKRQQSRNYETADRRRIRHQIMMAEMEMDHRSQQARLRRKSRAVDVPFLVLMVIACSVSFLICFNYVQIRSETNARVDSIMEKKQELENLRLQNAALQNSIDTSVDLNEIYRVATQELGMVYPQQGDIIKYNKTESGYVRQYDNIQK